MKFSWRDFLLGALCSAIVMAAGAGTWVWWAPENNDPIVYVEPKGVPLEDIQTYDMCLAAGNTTVACDATMRVLARARAWDEQAKVKQEVEKKLAEGGTKCDIVKWARGIGFWARDMGLSIQVSTVLGTPVEQLDNEC